MFFQDESSRNYFYCAAHVPKDGSAPRGESSQAPPPLPPSSTKASTSGRTPSPPPPNIAVVPSQSVTSVPQAELLSSEAEAALPAPLTAKRGGGRGRGRGRGRERGTADDIPPAADILPAALPEPRRRIVAYQHWNESDLVALANASTSIFPINTRDWDNVADHYNSSHAIPNGRCCRTTRSLKEKYDKMCTSKNTGAGGPSVLQQRFRDLQSRIHSCQGAAKIVDPLPVDDDEDTAMSLDICEDLSEITARVEEIESERSQSTGEMARRRLLSAIGDPSCSSPPPKRRKNNEDISSLLLLLHKAEERRAEEARLERERSSNMHRETMAMLVQLARGFSNRGECSTSSASDVQRHHGTGLIDPYTHVMNTYDDDGNDVQVVTQNVVGRPLQESDLKCEYIGCIAEYSRGCNGCAYKSCEVHVKHNCREEMEKE